MPDTAQPLPRFVPPRPVPLDHPLPILLGLWRLRNNLIDVWTERSYTMKMGRRRALFRSIYVVNDPDAVRQVLITRADNYHKSRQMQRALSPLVGNGMFISNGSVWRRQRTMAAPAFSAARLREMYPQMVEAIGAMVDRWATLPDGTVLNIEKEMSHVTADVVTRTMFSGDLTADEASTVHQAFMAYQSALGQVDFAEMLGMPDWVPRWPNISARRNGQTIRAVIDRIVERRLAKGPEGDRADILSVLINARDDQGRPMDRQDIADQLAVVFLAGHETSASALTWAFYLLSRQPSVEARLHAEVDAVLGNRFPTAEDLPRLDYTRRVFQETLRLYPPVAVFSREAQTPDRLRDHNIPAGSMVVIMPWLIHRHRKLWDDPDAFDPDRFLPENSKGRSQFAFLPFGAGPRTCAGAAFAMMEAGLILAAVAQRWRLRLTPEDHPVTPRCRLTVRPSNQMPMRLEAR